MPVLSDSGAEPIIESPKTYRATSVVCMPIGGGMIVVGICINVLTRLPE
jgi:hypothetical protein